MKTETVAFAGDTPGHHFEMRVLRFEGRDQTAPKAYLQASLHGGELPGGAALHHLVPKLIEAEARGAIRGDITIVPQANPLASSQFLFLEHMGRFDFAGRTNFNRDFPLLETFDTSGLPAPDAPVSLDKRIKAQLLRMALEHEIVLDLHCDVVSPSYVYVHEALWPHMADLAASLGSVAVLLMDSTVTGAFDEACCHPVLALPEGARHEHRRAISTVELRGLLDVSDELGMRDATGLFGFLVGRGVVSGEADHEGAGFEGPVVSTNNVEVVAAESGGMVLFDVDCGAEVREGQRIARIVPEIGTPDRDVAVVAPQSGIMLTRAMHPYVRRGDDICKLLGTRRSDRAKPGALEA